MLKQLCWVDHYTLENNFIKIYKILTCIINLYLAINVTVLNEWLISVPWLTVVSCTTVSDTYIYA